MANILILGGGFGGLMIAEQLAALLGGASHHRITLVSPRDKFTFYPALVRLAFGKCRPEDITFDLVQKLNELNVHYVRGEVINLKPDLKQVQIAGDDFDGELAYDYLIVAFGRRLAIEKIDGFAEHAHHLLGVNAARKFGASVDGFEKGKIVVALSPQAFLPIPVCETAFALANRFEKEIEAEEISVNVVFPETIEKAFGGANLHKKLERAFDKRRINVITDFAVRQVTAQTIVSEHEQTINYDLLMLVPPFGGQEMNGELGAIDEKNFVRVDNFMRVENLDKVYAVGDVAAFRGPKLAYMAVRQAQVAAANIVAEIRGGMPAKIYRHDIAAIIDEYGDTAIFLHYGVWDETLYGLKEGKMWSRMKNSNNQLWEVMRDA
jgi:sulfide:quinone oxidoreductase